MWRYLEDARVLTAVSALALSAALWIGLAETMSGMNMAGMDMADMDMADMDMADMDTAGGGMDMGAGDADPSGVTGGGMTSDGGMTSGDGMAGSGMAQDGMDMDMGMSMDPSDWSARTIIATSVMWLTMMLAMMLPSMAPVMSAYAAISAKEDQGARLALRIAIFTLGYFALWGVFSVAAAMLQLSFRGSAYFTMGGVQATSIAAAGLLIAAGLYQFTPVKDACLRHCRSPLVFLLSHWRPGVAGAFQVGARHGVYCVGCCWVFMGLMFVFGAMTLWWMAVLAAYFVGEKLLPQAEIWGRMVGAGLIIAGVGVLIAEWA